MLISLLMSIEIIFFLIILADFFTDKKNNQHKNTYDEDFKKFFDKWRKMTEEEKNQYIDEFKNKAFNIKDF